MVSPGKQQGGEKVSCPYKYSIHFGDVHADFLTGLGPVWFHYSAEDRWGSDIKIAGTIVIIALSTGDFLLELHV